MELPDFNIVKGNEQQLEEFENSWGLVDTAIREVVIDYVHYMTDLFPNMEVSFDFQENGRVRVNLYPPKDSPAYNPEEPNQCLTCVIG
ncbi:MAG TPA: hypothetical protein VEP90_23200 [Methylomirabilota bacterium]|nr:hypothetical protein [Methylomirabilota bacterium]